MEPLHSPEGVHLSVQSLFFVPVAFCFALRWPASELCLISLDKLAAWTMTFVNVTRFEMQIAKSFLPSSF